jgi:HD-like signal output (HDOD) protein
MPELAALVAKDAGMTSKILTVANSSAYHRGSRRSASSSRWCRWAPT